MQDSLDPILSTKCLLALKLRHCRFPAKGKESLFNAFGSAVGCISAVDIGVKEQGMCAGDCILQQ